MQQGGKSSLPMNESTAREKIVVVHVAATSSEAMVIRSLLESAGVASPDRAPHDPFPLREPPKGMPGVEIFVLSSQADEARRIIADYLRSDSPPAE